jgi:hypothetical protein
MPAGSSLTSSNNLFMPMRHPPLKEGRILAWRAIRFSPSNFMRTPSRKNLNSQLRCLRGNEVRFLSLSRTAKVKPEYRPWVPSDITARPPPRAVDHYRATGRILLHDEVKAIVLKRKRACTKEGKHETRPARRAVFQEEMRL